MPFTIPDEYAVSAVCYDLLVEPWLRPLRRRAAARIAAAGHRRVLDCCCGTGRQARLLAALPGRRVLGLDRSPAMLAQAAQTARGGPRRLDWILADACSPGLKSAVFDAAVVSFALHEKSAAAAARMLAELRRLLRPGGRLLAIDFAPPSDPRSRLAHRFIEPIERAAGRRHHQHYRAFLAAGGLDPLLAAARFQVRGRERFLASAIILVDAEPSMERGRPVPAAVAAAAERAYSSHQVWKNDTTALASALERLRPLTMRTPSVRRSASSPEKGGRDERIRL